MTARLTGTCFDQMDGDTGVTIVTQNFESSFDAYDSEGADDFILTKACHLKRVTVSGTYFNGSGPADSFNIAIHKDANGVPGKVCRLKNHVKCRNAQASYVTNADLTWTINPGSTWRLKPGHYWLSLQLNMSFSGAGEGGWDINDRPANDLAVWRNPGGGFGVGCTNWGTVYGCLQIGQGDSDYVFAVN